MLRSASITTGSFEDLDIKEHKFFPNDYKGQILAGLSGKPQNGGDFSFSIRKNLAVLRGETWNLRLRNKELLLRFLSLDINCQVALLDAIERSFSSLHETLQLEISWTATKRRYIEIQRNGDSWDVQLM